MPPTRATRRTILGFAAVGALVLGPGCSAVSSDGDASAERSPASSTPETGTTGGDGSGQADGENVEDRVLRCEERYVRTTVLRDDETVESSGIDPSIVETASRSEGVYAVVESTFGVTRHGSEDEPDLHMDFQVTAAYLVTDDGVYRTEDVESGSDPREGTVVDC